MKSSKLNKIIASFLTLFACFSIGYGSWNIHAEKSYSVGEKGDKPVAYFEKTENKKTVKHYFTTIEAACETAGNDASNNTIYVIPGTDPIIENPCTLHSGDTLRFILDESTRDIDSSDMEKDGFADNKPETYGKNNITLKSKITIQQNANLVIAGDTGGGSPQGSTSGDYCQLTIDNGGSIECNGKITCYGYIKDALESRDNSENAKIIINEGGEIHEPLAIYDWGSGRSAEAKMKFCFPFNLYDLPNIRPKMKINYGGSLFCIAHIWGGTVGHQHPKNPILIVGKIGQKAFIQLGKSSSLTWNFDSSNSIVTSINSTDHCTYVDINGDFNLGSISVSMSGLSLNSEDYYLPISYIYKLSHDNGKANLDYKTKFMPGSSLKIGKNSVVNLNNNVLFYESNKTDYAIYDYSVSAPAILINNGVLNINSGFGGFIDTTNNTGVINVSSGYSTPNDSCETYAIEKADLVGLRLKALKTAPFASDGGKINYSEKDDGSNLKKNEPISKTKYLAKGIFWTTAYIMSLIAVNGDVISDGKKAKQFSAIATFTSFAHEELASAPTANWSLTSGYSNMSSRVDDSKITNGIITYAITFTLPENNDLNPAGKDKTYNLSVSLTVNGVSVSSNTLIFTVKHHYKLWS